MKDQLARRDFLKVGTTAALAGALGEGNARAERADKAVMQGPSGGKVLRATVTAKQELTAVETAVTTNKKEPASFEDYATVEAMVDGEPVYSLGNITYIYSISPDLMPGAEMQRGNTHPKNKIRPKKSWEITSNYAGSYEAQPSVRTAYNDSQPLLPIHLIDGDPDTAWASYGGFYPDARPEWIRIDLPRESVVSAIAMIASKRFALGNTDGYILSTTKYEPNKLTDWMGFHRWGGRSLPRELKIEVSRDGWKWETVYETRNLQEDESGKTIVRFEPRRAKMVRVDGNNFKHLLDKYVGYAWSIGELEVLDPEGRNLALLSRGAGVSVSSTSYLMNHDRLTQQFCWAPVTYDMGFKTANITADEGLQCWNNVERVKGKLEIDPAFDAMVTDLNQHGVHIWMGIDVKVNPIYKGRKENWRESRFREINNSYYDCMGWAYEDPELREPYMRYIRFVANHFKGRVDYYNVGSDWPGNPELVQTIRDTITGIDPRAKIAAMWDPGSPGRRMDAGGDLEEVRTFLRNSRKAIRAKRAEGYDGLIDASLMTWSIYPPGPAAEGQPAWKSIKDENGFTDYIYWGESGEVRAKLVAQFFVGSAGLDVTAMYCNPYFSSTSVGQSLFRVPSPGEIISGMQPDVGYYVLRTINTVLDGWKPAEFEVGFSTKRELEYFTFKRGEKELMVAAWIPGQTKDGIVEELSKITVGKGDVKKAWGIDLFNGTEQELDFRKQGETTIFPGILIKDYPTMIRLMK